MELPGEMFVKPVEGDNDTFAFRYDFLPEAKAVRDGAAQLVTEQENGDLIVEGYAAVWDGEDRQGENFAPGAFQEGIKAFLDGQASYCYHHKHDKLLGTFLDLREDEKGLAFKARVDGAIKTHPELGTYYEQIRKGSLRGMSVGGFFHRAKVDGKQKIVKCDFTEISSTPVPVHPGTSLTVLAGKALMDDLTLPEVPKIDGEVREDDLRTAKYLIEEFEALFTRIEQSVGKRKDTAAS